MAHSLLPPVGNVCFPNSIVCSAQGGFSQMRRRITGLIALAALAVILPACDNTANNNRTANVNANANANAVATATATPATVANTNRAPTREEYERNKERYNREAKGSGRTIGTGVNDGWL